MGTVENRARVLEENLLSLSGLNIKKEIKVLDIEIDYLGKNYIHTLLCGENNTENLVLLHGFGGSSVMFYRMLKNLGQHYKVYCLDLLGMGISSRPDFICSTTNETIEYFVESLEKWRVSLGLENFYLGGHSFGGYMAFHYSIKYTQYVSKLFLLSPLGFTKDISEFNLEKESNRELGFWERRFLKLRTEFFINKRTISEIVHIWGWLISFTAKMSFKKRFNLSSDDAQLLYDFLLETYKLPDSAQKALFYVVNPNIIAYNSIEESINKLNLPIICFYGDKDWMDCTGAKRVNRSKKENFELIYLSDCGHQVMMENPTELADYIISFK